jgi:putative PIN family toxin of toxin-antitoxin system
MRVLLDTNIVVSALLWGGKPYQVLKLAGGGDISLVSCQALIEELRLVLGRRKCLKQLAKLGLSPEDLCEDYAALVEFFEPSEIPRVVPNDPKDDVVLACALAGDCLLDGHSSLAPAQFLPAPHE